MKLGIRSTGCGVILVALGFAALAVHSGANAAGEGPVKSAAAKPAVVRPPADSASVAAGAKIFATYCVTCHGPKGKGDGPASVALKPKPRNFTDPKQFKSKDDDGLFAVISKGGAANKLSPAMPVWGKILKPEQIWNVIAYVHRFAPRDTGKAVPEKTTPEK
jgi:mono/diheme cytochrome c family protein